MSPLVAQHALLSLSLSPANTGVIANAAAAIRAVNFFMMRPYDTDWSVVVQILAGGERKTVVRGIHLDPLTFAELAFEDLEAQRVENVFLDRALERPRPVNRIVTVA